jgi:hypothetical protein
LGEAAAMKEQGTLNALDMDYSSCGFDHARSRPTKHIKVTKKAAYCPKMRFSPQSLARHLASPFFLLAALSYHEALTVAKPEKANAACAEADAGGVAGRDETPAARSVPTRRAATAWTKRRARPSRVHTKSKAATKLAREEAKAGTRAVG